MGWVLRLVETGIDGQSRISDVMEINRPDGLSDIGHLGLTLAEAKQLLARVQQEVVAAQTDKHGRLRPNCRSCGGRRVVAWIEGLVAKPPTASAFIRRGRSPGVPTPASGSGHERRHWPRSSDADPCASAPSLACSVARH